MVGGPARCGSTGAQGRQHFAGLDRRYRQRHHFLHRPRPRQQLPAAAAGHHLDGPACGGAVPAHRTVRAPRPEVQRLRGCFRRVAAVQGIVDQRESAGHLATGCPHLRLSRLADLQTDRPLDRQRRYCLDSLLSRSQRRGLAGRLLRADRARRPAGQAPDRSARHGRRSRRIVPRGRRSPRLARRYSGCRGGRGRIHRPDRAGRRLTGQDRIHHRLVDAHAWAVGETAARSGHLGLLYRRCDARPVHRGGWAGVVRIDHEVVQGSFLRQVAGGRAGHQGEAYTI